MSRSNYGKPFYVDVGTSIVAIRCASNRDVLVSYDFAGYPFRLKLAKDMCDRMNSEFEAALKREKSAIEADALAVGGIVEATRRESHFADVSKMGGNAAAMRKALLQTREWLNRLFKGGNDESAIDHIMSYLQHCRNVCAAALAAPPRNCDRFDTKDAAREAFQKLRGHRVWADVSLWDDRDEIEALFDWLFAFG